jgi:ribosome-binding factor A
MVSGGARDTKRVERFGERIRQELSDLLVRGRLHEPSLEGMLVSRVDVTQDLRNARVFVRHQDPEISPARKKALLAALARAKGFIRREIAERTQAKHAPELEFAWDRGLDNSVGIDALLAEINADAAKNSGGEKP